MKKHVWVLFSLFVLLGLLAGPAMALTVQNTAIDWHIFNGDSASSIYTIADEPSDFSDVTLFCPLDAYDASTNTTPCYYQGVLANATINFVSGYPKLVSGVIGNALRFGGVGSDSVKIASVNPPTEGTIFFFAERLGPGVDQDRENLVRFSTSQLHVRWNNWGCTGVTTSNGTTSNSINVQYLGDSGKFFFVIRYNLANKTVDFRIYDTNKNLVRQATATLSTQLDSFKRTDIIIGSFNTESFNGIIDEFRYYNKWISDDEIKLLYLAGRKKLSEPANFRQIFSPLIDLTRDRATFYAGLEVSTSDPNGYVPVPESAGNMSITSAEKLKSDYTGAPFYYQGHYWYRADKIQFNLPIQFETVRERGGFSKEIPLDDDKKTFVYEKEFKATNPTATRLNVVYKVDPTALGFSPLQYPQFELDGVRMAEWRPSNSSTLYLIRTDSLEPGEISAHWIKSVWTLTKDELDFPAKLDDFRSINDWSAAQRMAENAAEGKTDTYVKVIKIDSNADVSNVTILVPLKDVEDGNDVIEAVALTGSREVLQVEKLKDGKVVVKVPGTAFVSGHAEVKVLYNKESSFWQRILNRIHSMMAKIKSFFGLGGG